MDETWTWLTDLRLETWPLSGPPPVSCVCFLQGDVHELVECIVEDTELLCELGNPFKSNQEVQTVGTIEFKILFCIFFINVSTVILLLRLCYCVYISGPGLHHISAIWDQFSHQRDSFFAANVHVWHTLTHACTHTHIHTCMYTNTCTYTHTHIQICTHTDTQRCWLVTLCVFRLSEQSDLFPQSVSILVEYSLQASLTLWVPYGVTALFITCDLWPEDHTSLTVSWQNQSARPCLLQWSCDWWVSHEENRGYWHSASFHPAGLS